MDLYIEIEIKILNQFRKSGDLRNFERSRFKAEAKKVTLTSKCEAKYDLHCTEYESRSLSDFDLLHVTLKV